MAPSGDSIEFLVIATERFTGKPLPKFIMPATDAAFRQTATLLKKGCMRSVGHARGQPRSHSLKASNPVSPRNSVSGVNAHDQRA